MKKIILYFLCFLTYCISSRAQENENLHRSYMFNTEIDLEQAIFNGDAFENTENTANSYNGQRFKLISVQDSLAIIKIYDYVNKDLKIGSKSVTKTYIQDNNNSLFFKLPIKLMGAVADKIYPIYAGETFGTVSIPFKLRLGDNDFETNANIGVNFGVRYRLNRKLEDRWILQPNIGIGLADIPLNSSNSEVENTENRTALSYSLGLMLNVTKNTNIGFFLGVDRLNKANQTINWKYQGKGWLGIGINIGFNESKSTKDNIKNKK